MASGHVAPHQQAGHMAAPTSLAPPSKKTLAKGEPSTHGTSRTVPRPWGSTAIEGKADVSPTRLIRPLLTQSGPPVAHTGPCHSGSRRQRFPAHGIHVSARMDQHMDKSQLTRCGHRLFWRECRSRYWFSRMVEVRAYADCASSLRAEPRSRCCRLPCQGTFRRRSR